MGLGMNYESGSGDFTPIVKYDSRAGRMFRIDRADRVSTPVDITRNFKAVFDMENIEVGYMNFPVGAAPQFQLVPLGDPFPNNPGQGFKQGVRLMMKLHKDCGGTDADKFVREMATSAKAAMRGIDNLHTAYETGEKQNPGKLPIVTIKDTIAITSEGQGQKTTNYEPVFEIIGWVERPKDLVFRPKANGAQAAAPATQSQAAPLQRAAPPSTGSTRVEAPASKQPAMADDDFG